MQMERNQSTDVVDLKFNETTDHATASVSGFYIWYVFLQVEF